MANRLKGKRIIITGAVNNIGKEAAALFVEEGARVCIGDIDEKAGPSTAKELGATFIKVDVRQEDGVKSFIEQAVASLGGLDVLVQNAGLQRSGQVTGFQASDWDALFAVNSRAHFFGAKYAVPHIRRAGGHAFQSACYRLYGRPCNARRRGAPYRAPPAAGAGRRNSASLCISGVR